MADLENYEGSIKQLKDGNEHVYDPMTGMYMPIVDATQKFKEITDRTPANEEELNTFYCKRIGMIRKSPYLTEDEKAQRIRDFMVQANLQEDSYASGDQREYGLVAFGVYYKPDKLGFTRSTKLHHHIISPATAGGDNADFLYLTATNRAAKGVEAFASYFAQEPVRFRVYDWARQKEQQWQIAIENVQLQPYLATMTSGPFISVINSTELLQKTTWRNSVLLFNTTTNTYDKIYQYDYILGSNSEQHDDHHGSWGPIVETRQANYESELNPMGCFYTYIFLDDAINTLYESNTTHLSDNVGVELLSLQPNHSFLVH